MRKRTGFFVLSLFSVVILAACGNTSTDSSSNSENSQKEEPNTTSNTEQESEAGEVKEIVVKATNFKFEPSEIRVKKGEKIKLTLQNDEGYHGVMIHELNLNIEGNDSAEFVADQVGEYNLMCSVMCGTGHGDMIGKIIVEE